MKWLKKWGAAIAGVLLVILGAGWLWRRQQARIGKLKDRLAVEEATKKIGELRVLREEVKDRVGEKDEAIADLDRQLLDNQRRIIEAYEGGEGLSDEEMLEEFRRLGI
jgi:uncharacterized protein HemX